MWQRLWKKWTIDKPAALGDWLWDVFVVQFAARLDKLTWRHVVALIPLTMLIIAYAHRIPVPPELALAGDLFAYIDIFSALFLLGALSRVATVIYLVKKAASDAVGLITRLQTTMRWSDGRHRRESGARRRLRFGNRSQEDDGHIFVEAFAWT